MQIEITQDGSSTIFIPEWNERYHSKNGAIQESLYVYIQNGLNHCFRPQIHILEIGLGTGLNVLLTILHQKNDTSIHYISLEPYPLNKELYTALNFIQLAEFQNLSEIYFQIHECAENTPQLFKENFCFTKLYTKIQDFRSDKKFDLVYWDAFGPRVQPEMWSLDLCKKIYDLLNPNGFIVTYCAQGQFKRNLKAAGFKVESLPGPLLKREMTRAMKANCNS